MNMIKRKSSAYGACGFTLIELAVILFIVGALSIGIISGIKAQLNTAKLVETRTQTERVKQAILHFVRTNQYAPCPDISGLGNTGYGQENRSGGVCSASYGEVPFEDLGLSEAEVKDTWGNKLAYAVNTQVTNGATICDAASSASYFCDQQVPAFDLQSTPPIKGDLGAGNYTVCNENVSSCSGSTGASDLQADGISILLVAYNEDGQETLSNCAAKTGATNENCDGDTYYHQAAVTSGSPFFDDYIVTISGYEIKKIVFELTDTAGMPTNFSNFAKPSPPDVTNSNDLAELSQEEADTATDGVDVGIISGLESGVSLDMKAGDDRLLVEDTMENGEQIDMGSGNDNLQLESSMDDGAVLVLGLGQDQLTIDGSVSGVIYGGGGSDRVWIKQNLETTGTIEMGDGNDALWIDGAVKGSVDMGDGDDYFEIIDVIESTASLDGGEGTDRLVLPYTQAEWDAGSLKDSVTNFETFFFAEP